MIIGVDFGWLVGWSVFCMAVGALLLAALLYKLSNRKIPK